MASTMHLSSVRPAGLSVRAPRRASVPMRAAVAPRAAANIVETAKAAGNFTKLLAALQATGLDSLLSGTSNHTVFAPTDAAFAKLPAGTLDALLKDKDKLSRILAFHVCKGKTASKYIISGSGQMPTMCELPSTLGAPWKVTLVVDHVMNGKNGQPLVVGQNCAVVQGLQYEVRGGKVEKADIDCSNGIIHVIDTVMIPDVKYCGV